MSAVKDYLMWLEHKGFSELDSDDDLITQYKNDANWHRPPSGTRLVMQDEGDYIIEDDDEGVVIDDGDDPDLGWTPEDHWFTPDGGLTGEAWEFLATTDSKGDFI